ncbi:ABC transporter ATP-binding protein [Phycisphaerales bacterium AB-hyl4]|uniref:ABC transporter ATP-binding protein n=1 Tax=Natronomicrosphaera hydrolytica TaxID=3242702 RepID=A0ABV4U9Q1_9BACT
MQDSSPTDAIVVDGVNKRFGKHAVLDGVQLNVRPGETFAFLGRNGAGKTTTIRMMLGLMSPDAGTMRVLGLDPTRDALAIRRRVGYLAEDQQMWGWMNVEQIIRFMAPFYPSWDDDLARRYVRDFELPLKTRIRHLSKGQSVRLGLLLALAHRPELVILDDPALGLDPIMRKEFNRDVVTHLQGEGRTVFYSSHLLYEVEPVADRVAILDRGRIVRAAATDELREQVRQIVLPSDMYGRLDVPLKKLDVRQRDTETAVVVDDAPAAIAGLRARGVPHQVVDLNLDEIFEAFVIGRVDGEHAPPPAGHAVERVA